MPKLNWRVRVRSYPFWVAVFGIIGLIVTDTNVLDVGQYEGYVQAALLVLTTGGVIADPITEGYSDSKRGLSYDEPAPNVKSTKVKKHEFY